MLAATGPNGGVKAEPGYGESGGRIGPPMPPGYGAGIPGGPESLGPDGMWGWTPSTQEYYAMFGHGGDPTPQKQTRFGGSTGGWNYGNTPIGFTPLPGPTVGGYGPPTFPGGQGGSGGSGGGGIGPPPQFGGGSGGTGGTGGGGGGNTSIGQNGQVLPGGQNANPLILMGNQRQGGLTEQEKQAILAMPGGQQLIDQFNQQAQGQSGDGTQAGGGAPSQQGSGDQIPYELYGGSGGDMPAYNPPAYQGSGGEPQPEQNYDDGMQITGRIGGGYGYSSDGTQAGGGAPPPPGVGGGGQGRVASENRAPTEEELNRGPGPARFNVTPSQLQSVGLTAQQFSQMTPQQQEQIQQGLGQRAGTANQQQQIQQAIQQVQQQGPQPAPPPGGIPPLPFGVPTGYEQGGTVQPPPGVTAVNANYDPGYGTEYSGDPRFNPARQQAMQQYGQQQSVTPPPPPATQQTGSGFADSVAQSYGQQQDAANQANEGRYQAILGGHLGRLEGANQAFAGLSDQDRQDTQQQFQNYRGTLEQDLVNRGLGNTTVRSNVLTGVEREENAALRRLADQRTLQQLGVTMGAQGDTLRFMEGRTDQAPDYQQMLALLQMYGQSGGGQPLPGSYVAM